MWTLGNTTITRVIEVEMAGGTRFLLPDATREAILPIDWLRPHFADDAGNLIMSIHSLIIETPTLKILVDTCLGNEKKRDIPIWNQRSGPFLEDLAAAGHPAESIDRVLCTHLHVDHVGWNTRKVEGRWVPTFANARYLFGREEWHYWDHHSDEEPYREIMKDSVRPIVDAGLVDLVESNERICPEVSLRPTPGHTPGHVSVAIESEGERALITGDFLHHPCQMARPEWCSTADWNSENAEVTRREMLAELADSDILVIGTHFATPSAGRVVRAGQNYRLDPGV